MTESNPDALKSLYGKGHAEATTEANRARAREAVAMPGVRNQTVLTPPWLLGLVRSVWQGTIALDPCSSGDDHVSAEKHYTITDDGLSLPWEDRTFVNPPYSHLKVWMHKAQAEMDRGVDELIMLIPMRTHRKWFDLASYDAVCFLNPIKFDGEKQAAPFPCVVAYHGKYLHRFASLFADQGRVCKVVPLRPSAD